MKNSTLLFLIITITVFGWLIYSFTEFMVFLLSSLGGISIIIYLLISTLDYNNAMLISERYNIWHHANKFFIWLDEKPKLIRKRKKHKNGLPEEW